MLCLFYRHTHYYQDSELYVSYLSGALLCKYKQSELSAVLSLLRRLLWLEEIKELFQALDGN